jgi:hypothetical protein
VLAQTNTICEELQGRFADLPQVVGSSEETRDLSRAIVRQNVAIRRMWSDMRNQGCTDDSSLVIVGGDGEACDRMQSDIGHLQDDLEALKDRRGQSLSRASGEVADRRRLLAALKQNNCGLPASSVPDQVITNRFIPDHRQPMAYAPTEASTGDDRSSITVIETPKPQATIGTPQQKLPAGVPIVAGQPVPRQQAPDRPYDPAAHQVRQVGPQFLATDQGTIDLRHPKAAGPQPQQ